MIIVSQDETMFINFDNVSAIAIDDNNTKKQIHARCNNDDDVMLGEYATEERTKEILQEIVEKYEDSTIELGKKIMSFGEYNFVYEMPKE